MESVYLLKKPTTQHYLNFVFGSGLVMGGGQKKARNITFSSVGYS